MPTSRGPISPRPILTVLILLAPILRVTAPISRMPVLKGACLKNADLSGANLKFANLDDANLSEADLTGAILEGARLNRAHLVRARFDSANLRFAKLDKAKLEYATIVKADLRYSILTGADLHGVNLPAALLSPESESQISPEQHQNSDLTNKPIKGIGAFLDRIREDQETLRELFRGAFILLSRRTPMRLAYETLLNARRASQTPQK